MYDGIEGQAKGAKLLFLTLLKRASDFAAFAMMNAPAEAVTQLRVVELGQDAPAERRVVDILRLCENPAAGLLPSGVSWILPAA
jgi:hypothetical protein